MLDIFDMLRAIRCHIIVSAHVIPLYGLDPSLDEKQAQYSPRVEVGESIAISPQLRSKMLMYFNEVYRFSRSSNGQQFFVKFRSDLAKTAYTKLPNEELEITNKPFYEVWKGLI